MKIAPLLRALEEWPDISTTLIHTGQHYDENLSAVFFEELGIKQPDVHLGVAGGTHGEQTARILEATEKILDAGAPGGQRFAGLVVVGDVNSTMAASLAAAKLKIPIAHVEAGLRSFDRSMPEEINRLVTDAISQVLLVSEPSGVENLIREGHSQENIFLVGNVMIDTLLQHLEHAQSLTLLADRELQPNRYGVVTMHRPANVDDRQTLSGFVDVLRETAQQVPLLFPVHPRTRARLEGFDLWDEFESAQGMQLMEPLGYFDFLCLTSQAQVVITDSGGLQEETTALGIPCITLRQNTERPITVDQGTSTLIGNDAVQLRETLHQVLTGKYKRGSCPQLWDGKAAERIAEVLAKQFA